MAYQVLWQLVGRSGHRLDGGRLGEGFCNFADAVAAVVEFLRPYPEVNRCPEESYWLARRSSDADLAVWIWVECQNSDRRVEVSQRPDPARLRDKARFHGLAQPT